MVYGIKYHLLPNTSPDPDMNWLGIPGGIRCLTILYVLQENLLNQIKPQCGG